MGHSWAGFWELPDIEILLVQESDTFLIQGFVLLLQQRQLL